MKYLQWVGSCPQIKTKLCGECSGSVERLVGKDGRSLWSNYVPIKGNLGESRGDIIAMGGILPTDKDEMVWLVQRCGCEVLELRWEINVVQCRSK